MVVSDDVIEFFLEDEDTYQAKATDLVSAKQLRERDKAKVKEHLESGFLSKIRETACERIYEDMSSLLEEEELRAFYLDLLKINRIDESREGDSFQEIFDLSDTTLRQIYRLGYHYFQNKQYEDAVALFIFLKLLNPYVFAFWNSLGLSYFAQELWKEALECFQAASEIEPENLYPHLLSVACFLELKERSQAKAKFTLVEEIAGKDSKQKQRWEATINHYKELCV